MIFYGIMVGQTIEKPWKHHGKKHENPMGISTWMKPQIAGSGRWAPWASLGKAVSRGCGRSQWVYDRLWMAMAYLSESILSILLQSHKWKWEIQRLVEIMIWDKRFIALFTILIHVPLPSAKLGAQKARSVTRIGTTIWPSWKVWRALPKTTHLITPAARGCFPLTALPSTPRSTHQRCQTQATSSRSAENDNIPKSIQKQCYYM